MTVENKIYKFWKNKNWTTICDEELKCSNFAHLVSDATRGFRCRRWDVHVATLSKLENSCGHNEKNDVTAKILNFGSMYLRKRNW